MVVVAGGHGVITTEIINLETKAMIPGGPLWSQATHLVTVGSGYQLRIQAFGGALVQEWDEETLAWREAGRLEESRTSQNMGVVAVPEGLVCKKQN